MRTALFVRSPAPPPAARTPPRLPPRSCTLLVCCALLFLLSLFPASLAAQVVVCPTRSELARFSRYSMDEGLSGFDVRAVTQDRHGFMWFGTTMGGLNRFDGYSFKVYTHDPKNPSSLSHNYIWAAFTDSRGRLWLGTSGGGLNRYLPETDGFLRFESVPDDPTSLSHNSVLSLLEDKHGVLWVGTRNGLNAMDQSESRFTRHIPQVEGVSRMNMATVRCIAEDPSSNLLWIGTSDGLFAFDRSTSAFQGYSRPQDNDGGVGYNSINAILPQSDGSLWLATEFGLCRFTPPSRHVAAGTHPLVISDWECFLIESSTGLLATNLLRSIIPDSNGGFWVGTADGLRRFDPRTRTYTLYNSNPGSPDALTSNVINRLFIDQQGGLWVATTYGGVNRLRPAGRGIVNHAQIPGDTRAGLSANIVTAVSSDSKGRVWVGTLNGLNVLEGDRWTQFFHDPADPASLSGNHVSSIVEDTAGDIWVGTPNQGINRYDGERFHHYLNPNPGRTPSFAKLPYTSTQIGPMFLDPKGRLWISGRGYGLDCYENGLFTHRAPVDEQGRRLPFASLTPGYLDENEGLWCSSELNGLVRIDVQTNRTEQYFPGDQSFRTALNTYGVLFDGEKRLWVPSISGLYHFDIPSRRFDRAYFASDGLPSDAILGVARDKENLLWLSSTNGVGRFDPSTGLCRIYQKPDGLPANQMLLGAITAAPDGRILLGTTAGLCTITPALLLKHRQPRTETVLCGLDVFDRPVVPRAKGSPLSDSLQQTTRLVLGSAQSVFSLHFSTLDFDAPASATYSTMLEGFDSTWRTSTRRTVNYMNLPPGDYVFKVRGGNADHVWSTQPTSLAITIRPAWYASTAFRWSLGAGLVLGCVLFYRHRLRSMHRRNQELARLVEERTQALQEEVVERSQAEEALRESHAHLEERVAQRTAELAGANQQLRAEIAERTRIEADLRRSEEHLRQSQKMEAFGQLAGGIAHDFNNILTVVIGETQVARDPSTDETTRLESLREISRAADRAAELTRQLLVFGRKQSMNRVSADLATVVSDLARMLARIIGEDIRLEITPADRPHPVNADVSMLGQVLVNMAVNARDAMRGGGRLSIRLDGRVISAEEKAGHPHCPAPGAYSCIHVKDTGAGIPPEVMARIFEPFFTTKESGRGTGLGLATCQSIVSQHGGWIEVRSTPGAGTEFIICLPVAAPAAGTNGHAGRPAAPAEDASAAAATARACILLVEDEPGVRRSIARMLERQGHRIIEAESADKAMELWQERGAEVGLLLTDIVMPGSLNGHALASRLQQLRPGLPTIMMSGYDPSQLAARGLAGAQHQARMLQKPFALEDLLRTIREVLPRS